MRQEYEMLLFPCLLSHLIKLNVEQCELRQIIFTYV